MTFSRMIPIVVALGVATPALAQPTSVDAMRWHHRILLIATPDPRDPKAALQRRVFADWQAEAADRDVVLVELSGTHVTGVTNDAATLTRRYHLAPGVFQALLIGKDGHVALRSAKPVDAGTLQSTIDAMPMRKAGQR